MKKSKIVLYNFIVVKYNADIKTRKDEIPMKAEKNCVMICVTPQISCARLIEAGIEIAREENGGMLLLDYDVYMGGERTSSALMEITWRL